MPDIDPFAGLIKQVLAYQPPAQKLRLTQLDPYDRILALQRMERGESAADIARDLGCAKVTVESWRRKAREASHG